MKCWKVFVLVFHLLTVRAENYVYYYFNMFSSPTENREYVDYSFWLFCFLFYAGKLTAQSPEPVLFRVLKQGWLIQNSLFIWRCYFFLLYSALVSSSVAALIAVISLPWCRSHQCSSLQHVDVTCPRTALKPWGVPAQPRDTQAAGYLGDTWRGEKAVISFHTRSASAPTLWWAENRAGRVMLNYAANFQLYF